MANIIAAYYDEEADYAIGDYVIYEDTTTSVGKLYKCKTAISGGEVWTSAHWDETNVSGQINDLKNTVDKIYMTSDNLYNPATDRHSVNLNNSGVETSDAEFKTSDYIYVGNGDKVTIQCTPNQWKIYFFTSNSDSGYSRSLWITESVSQTFALGAVEKYIRITMKEAVTPFMVNMGNTLLPYTPYGGFPGSFLQDIIDDIDDEIDGIIEDSNTSVESTFSSSKITNLLTTDTTLSETGKPADAKAVGDEVTDLKSALDDVESAVGFKILSPEINKSININTGVVSPSNVVTENGFCCLCVPCTENDVFTVTGKGGNNTQLWGFADSNGTVLTKSGAGKTGSNLKITAPTGSAYFAFNSYTNVSYGVTKGVSPVEKFDEIDNQTTDLRGSLNKTSQTVYKTDISSTVGLIPFHAKKNDSITIKTKSGSVFEDSDQLRFYDASGTYIKYWSTIPYTVITRTFTYDQNTDAYYIGITKVASNVIDYEVINNSSPYLTEITNKDIILQTQINLVDNKLTDLDGQSAKRNVVNRFDKTTITEGKYLDPNSINLNTNVDFFASDFIYIGDLETVKVSKTHIVIWADENKEWLSHPESMNSLSSDIAYTVPEGAKYIRFSTYNTSLDTAQVGENITRDNYVPHDVYTLPGLKVSQSQISTEDDAIIVDANGNGDYTSFTQAVKDNLDTGEKIYVMPGTYDIVSEYVAIWGQSAVNSMADADSATFNGFQYGVILRNRIVEFAPGAHLVCDWTGHTVDGTHRFSAIRVDYNCKIIGLDLDATATFYCIHDDYGVGVPYTVTYDNCRVVGHDIHNANCIGGGCKKYSRHILKNCYFDNNLTGSATVRYHNTNDEGAEPEIYVSNCYFNNWFTPRWYGTQTSKMKVYVNNCEARSIHKLAESSRYNVDNVVLYKWCNTETNPVT